MQTSDQKIWSRDVKLYVLFISDVRIKKWYFVKTWKDDSILSVYVSYMLESNENVSYLWESVLLIYKSHPV